MKGSISKQTDKTLQTAGRLGHLLLSSHTVTLHLLLNRDKVLTVYRISEALVDADGAVDIKIACRLCVTGGDNAGIYTISYLMDTGTSQFMVH